MRIAAYCRVSTDHADQLNSLETQKEFFELYAQQNGHKLYRVYADEGLSGTRMKNRVELQRLMEDAKLGVFESVVIKDVSRLARNTVDFLRNIRSLKSMGIATTFVTNNMSSLGDSEFVLTIFGAMAQEESANLSKRVKFGKDINSKKGRVPPWIFGYDRVDNFTLRINEREAAIVRDIYDMFINRGLGTRLIAKELEERGETAKFGGAWDSRTVRRILDNPIYSGHYVNHRYHVPDFLEGGLSALPEEKHYHHERPAWRIVSPEDYDRAQKMREERREKYGGGEKHTTGRYSGRHRFSTLIKCECCGRSFYRYSRKRKNGSEYAVWKCTTNNEYTHERCPNSTNVREDELTACLSEYFRSLIRDKKRVAQRLLEVVAQQKGMEGQEGGEESLRKRIDRLEKQIDKHMELYAEGLIDMERLKEKLAALRSEIGTLQERLLVPVPEGCRQRDTQRYLEEIENFLSLKTANNTDLRKLISSISVNEKREVTIHLRDFT